MRPVVVAAFAALVLAGCTKKNPAVCCTTAVQCDEYGFDEVTPCAGFAVCLEGVCEAPTCTTSVDCGATTPYCVDTVCSADCSDDQSCIGADAGMYCSAEGDCVDCIDSSQCSEPSAAVCEDTTHTCRPCADDDECISGVCLAAEGVCASEDEVIFIAMGGVDAGDCTPAEPCASIDFGLTHVSANRQVLRLVSLDLVDADGVLIAQDVYIDGADTRIQRTSSGAVVTIMGGATVTIEGVRITGTANAIDDVSSSLTLSGVEIAGRVEHSGHLTILDSEIRSDVRCNGSTLDIDQTVFSGTSGTVHVSSCNVAITNSQFGASGLETAAVSGLPSRIRFENNIVLRGIAAAALDITGSAAQSTVRFNTFVATSDNAAFGAAVRCLGAASLNSNVFAWHSAAPITVDTTCATSYSVFDEGLVAGTGNVEQSFNELFVDAAAGNYLPAATSVAREASDPALEVVTDHAGAPRPQPAGSVSDAGAFEVE